MFYKQMMSYHAVWFLFWEVSSDMLDQERFNFAAYT